MCAARHVRRARGLSAGHAVPHGRPSGTVAAWTRRFGRDTRSSCSTRTDGWRAGTRRPNASRGTRRRRSSGSIFRSSTRRKTWRRGSRHATWRSRPSGGTWTARAGGCARTAPGSGRSRRSRPCSTSRGGCAASARSSAIRPSHGGPSPASEDRFGLLVRSVQDYAIFLLDPGGRISSWNAGAERIKGYAAEEIIGQHFSVFYPPEDVAAGKPARELEVAAEQGRLEDEGWRVRKDGTPVLGQRGDHGAGRRAGAAAGLRQGHPGRDRTPRGRTGAAGERRAVPAPGAERPGLRDLHAGPGRPDFELERGGGADQGLCGGGDHRPALLGVLPAGGRGGGEARA